MQNQGSNPYLKLQSLSQSSTNALDGLGKSARNTIDAITEARRYFQKYSREEDIRIYNEPGFPNLERAIKTHPPEYLFFLHSAFDDFFEVSSEDRCTLMRWCEEHCEDKYTSFLAVGFLYFGFYNKRDATLFRLTHTCNDESDEIQSVLDKVI